jgi:nicotinamide-nucleotide adenylyltransferase
VKENASGPFLAGMKRVGLVCRFKPVHLGHAAMLETLCERAEHVVIGLGSPNRKDARNPFSAEESARMIELVLGPRFRNFELVRVADLGDGPRWAKMVEGIFGELDSFVTANAYVRDLLAATYRVEHPGALIPRARHVPIDATLVRARMLEGGDWRSLVPPVVASYLDAEGLVVRFRREFGHEPARPL